MVQYNWPKSKESLLKAGFAATFRFNNFLSYYRAKGTFCLLIQDSLPQDSMIIIIKATACHLTKMICYKYCFNSLFINVCMIFNDWWGSNVFSIPWKFWKKTFDKDNFFEITKKDMAYQAAWEWVCPQELVIQCPIWVDPLAWVQPQEFVDQVTRVGVLDVVLQPLFHLPLLSLGQLHLGVQLQLLHTGPDLRGDGAAQLRDRRSGH